MSTTHRSLARTREQSDLQCHIVNTAVRHYIILMLIYSMICCIAKQAIDKAESCIHSINQPEVVVYSATIFNHMTHYVMSIVCYWPTATTRNRY